MTPITAKMATVLRKAIGLYNNEKKHSTGYIISVRDFSQNNGKTASKEQTATLQQNDKSIVVPTVQASSNHGQL